MSKKVHLDKAMVFPVVMGIYESWTIKEAEHERIDAFELSCWRRFLRVPWTAKQSNQPILKEISPEYSLEGLMLKLKLPILWPPDAKKWLIWKDPDAGKNWKQEVKGMTEDEMVEWHHQPDGHEFEQAPGVGDGQGSLVCCCPWGHKESYTTERLNWVPCPESCREVMAVSGLESQLLDCWSNKKCESWAELSSHNWLKPDYLGTLKKLVLLLT